MLDLPDVNLSAAVELDIGDDDSHRQHIRKQAVIDRYMPREIKIPVGINVPATSAAYVFVTDEPSPGRRLQITRFHLDIATPIVANQTVAEPTTIIVYLVSAADLSNVNNLSSANVLERYTTLPIDDRWGNRQVYLDHPENVYIVVTNSGATPVVLAGNIQTINRATDQYGDPGSLRELLNDWNLA